MNVIDLLFFLILLDLTTRAAARIDHENGAIDNIADSTRILPPPPPPVSILSTQRAAEFKPGIAIIVVTITTLFSITLLVLLYVKHCRRSTYAANSNGNPLSRGNSGINRKVIESLPMFRFSSLRGQKDGLECAVCLSRFEAAEVLRLLPKCKHAFHVECVDTWLDEHSTCPLCRYRVEPEDVLVVDNSKTLYNHNGHTTTPRSSEKGKEVVGPRVSSARHSSAGERGASLEVIVEKPGQDLGGARASFSRNSRRKSASENLRSKSSSSWRSFMGKIGNSGRKDGQLPVQADKHRLDHRIIISDGEEGERRWSDVQAAEILYLKSEMILGEEEVITQRSVSEITGMSRFRSSNNGGRERREREEEGVAKRWMDWHHQNGGGNAATTAAAAASSSSSNDV